MSRPARTLTAAAVLTLLAVAVLPGAPGTAQARSSSGTNSEPQQMPSSPLTDVSATALSYTGRYVAHLAIRRDQTSPRQKVRRTDMSNGRSELLNPSIDGGIARGNYSRPPVISADGSRVSITSTAARLVPHDTNDRSDAFNSYDTDLAATDSADQEADLFIRNMTTERTRWLSAGFPAGANPSGVALSPNGRWATDRPTGTDQSAIG